MRRCAPSASIRPTSLVRSATAMVMIVTMPTPPTSSEMLPRPPTAIVRMSRMFDERAQHLFLGRDGEVLAAVARGQQLSCVGRNPRRGCAFGVGQMDLGQALAIE